MFGNWIFRDPKLSNIYRNIKNCINILNLQEIENVKEVQFEGDSQSSGKIKTVNRFGEFQSADTPELR